MFSRSAEFSPNSSRILPVVAYAGDQVWRLSELKLLSKRSSKLVMVTFTGHLRLCYSSMNIWRLNSIGSMQLLAPVEVNVSTRCTDRCEPGTDSCVPGTR